MGQLAERGWFSLCLYLGKSLRRARYSTVGTVDRAGTPLIQKKRTFYAPALIWLGSRLMMLLATRVTVLTQRTWVERERWLYRKLYGAEVGVTSDGAVLLPRHAGSTLASVLENETVLEGDRRAAIGTAVAALRDLHALGVTHADAMAENVMVDLGTGAARWFDFETSHEGATPTSWRRADDLRALLTTCAVRTTERRLAETVKLVLDGYGDGTVVSELSRSFGTPWQRSLAFHLGQAPLSYRHFTEIGRLVRDYRVPHYSHRTTGESSMKKVQIQGVHHITIVGSTKKSAVDFWQGVMGMPFIFEQPNLGNPDENHLYFDPGDGKLLTVFTNESRQDAGRPAPREVGSVDHIAFNVSRATFLQAPARLTAHGVTFYERDRGFMNSIYCKDPNGLTVELACYKFETPSGFRDADVMIQAHRLRTERGDHHITEEHLADAIEMLLATRDRLPV